MIITKIKGGLGNQMFQYALGKNLSLKNNTDLKLDIFWFKKLKSTKIIYRDYGLKNFNIEEKIATENEISKIKKNSRIPLLSKIKKEKKENFDPKILSVKNNVYLEGYWQSEKYFKDVENIIRQEFTLKNEPSKNVKEIEEKIKKSDNSISIHIRHGDYSQKPEENKRHTILPIEYYEKSIKFLEEKVKNPTYFIFSDDIDWCKKNIKTKSSTFFIENTKDYEDLILMSKCKHNIIANSSFSWWGAWLNKNENKIVIVAKNWYFNIDDQIPKKWLKI